MNAAGGGKGTVYLTSTPAAASEGGSLLYPSIPVIYLFVHADTVKVCLRSDRASALCLVMRSRLHLGFPVE